MDNNNFEIIKRSLGNVIYSQKTHEMAVVRKLGYIKFIKIVNIVLVALVLGTLFLQIFNPDKKVYLYIGIGFTILEVLFLIFQLSFNPEKNAREHKDTANKLWLMREKYLNLLTDIKNETYVSKTISEKRDALTLELNQIYESAPQTNNKDYKKASLVLNGDEKPRADDNEMDNFLPENLR
jgi:hypothetical protein